MGTSIIPTSLDGAAVSAFTGAGLNALSSLNLATPEGKATFVTLKQGTHPSLDTVIGQEISIRHVLVHEVNMVDDKTGEVTVVPRSVLLCDEGIYQATSWGVLDSLKLLAAVYGSPEWTPALKVRVTQVTTRKGRRTFTLTPVLPKTSRAK